VHAPRRYRNTGDLPAVIPVFPLTGALLLPKTRLPLNIFEPRYLAMIDAALSGLDVRFMMTGWPDKKIAYNAAESYFHDLAAAGVKVYRYKRGFFHAKTMTIDGQVAVIGTMNFDIRSLALHKELMAWFYDSELALEHEKVFLADMEECELITLEEIDSWSAGRRLRNSSARLASNLL